MTIEELGNIVTAGTVVVRGRSLEIKPVSDLVMQQIIECFTLPEAPLVKDVRKGSLAGMVRDETEAGYRAARRAWNLDTRAAQAVVGMGVVVVMGVMDAAQHRTLREAVAKLRATLTGEEIDRIVRAMDALTAAAIELALGN